MRTSKDFPACTTSRNGDRRTARWHHRSGWSRRSPEISVTRGVRGCRGPQRGCARVTRVGRFQVPPGWIALHMPALPVALRSSTECSPATGSRSGVAPPTADRDPPSDRGTCRPRPRWRAARPAGQGSGASARCGRRYVIGDTLRHSAATGRYPCTHVPAQAQGLGRRRPARRRHRRADPRLGGQAHFRTVLEPKLRVFPACRVVIRHRDRKLCALRGAACCA